LNYRSILKKMAKEQVVWVSFGMTQYEPRLVRPTKPTAKVNGDGNWVPFVRKERYESALAALGHLRDAAVELSKNFKQHEGTCHCAECLLKHAISATGGFK